MFLSHIRSQLIVQFGVLRDVIYHMMFSCCHPFVILSEINHWKYQNGYFPEVKSAMHPELLPPDYIDEGHPSQIYYISVFIAPRCKNSLHIYR